MSGDDILLDIRELRTHFVLPAGTLKAVDGISLTVRRGRTLAVIGESGSGKSVTAHSILRLERAPNARIVGGEILVRTRDGVVDVTKVPRNSKSMRAIRGKDVAMIFQEPMTSFGPLHTIGNQIGEAIATHNPDLSEAEVRDRIVSLLQQVGIPNAPARVDSYPHEFSGGMRQRAMIAMALSNSPQLLIADEPTTALDVTIEAQIMELLVELQKTTGMGILLISHNLAVVSEVAHDIAVMYLGKSVEFGTTEQIRNRPLHPYTQGLWNSIPTIDGPLQRLQPIPGTIPGARNLPPGCVFAGRCSQYMAGICDAPKPVPQIEVEPGHVVACYLYSDEAKPALAEEVREQDAPRDLVKAEVGDRPVIAVNGLKQYFPIRRGFLRRTVAHMKAVDDVSIALNAGETLGLVGESGSGKSTFGRAILRLYEPTAGEVLLHPPEGEPVSVLDLDRKSMRAARSEMQMIFQDPYASLNDRMTVLQNIIEPLVCNNVGDAASREERARQLLGQVGLRPEHMRRYPHSFSGGQRQRIGIARALAINPRFIVADEPVSALDVSVQAQILNLLRDLQAELGLSYLFISHDMAVIRYMSNRVAVMYVGRIVEYGTTDAVIQRPLHPYTEVLMSAVPRVSSETGRAGRIAMQGVPPDPANLPQGCVFQGRCPYVQDKCRSEAPQLREALPGHFAACHFAGSLDLAGIAATAQPELMH